MQNQEKKYLITESLANLVIQYLARKPYGEVYELVSAMQKIDEIKEEVTE